MTTDGDDDGDDGRPSVLYFVSTPRADVIFFEGGSRFCADVPNETADTDQRVSTTVGEHIVRKTSRSNWPDISWFRRCLEQEPPKQNLRYRPKGFRNGWGTHIERELNFGEFDEFTKESTRTRSTARAARATTTMTATTYDEPPRDPK